MKKILGTLFLFILCTQISAKDPIKIAGQLLDKNNDYIENAEVILTIRVCKNGDSLFQIKDTVMTKFLGGFETRDLRPYLEANPTTDKDTIEYVLTFEHEGETITTGKKPWEGVRFSFLSARADEATHAETADHAIMADEALSAQGVSTLDQAVETGGNGFIIGSNVGSNFEYGTVKFPVAGNFYLSVDDDENVGWTEDPFVPIADDIPPGSSQFTLGRDSDGKFHAHHFWHNTNIPDDNGEYNLIWSDTGDASLVADGFSLRFDQVADDSEPLTFNKDSDGQLEFNPLWMDLPQEEGVYYLKRRGDGKVDYGNATIENAANNLGQEGAFNLYFDGSDVGLENDKLSDAVNNLGTSGTFNLFFDGSDVGLVNDGLADAINNINQPGTFNVVIGDDLVTILSEDPVAPLLGSWNQNQGQQNVTVLDDGNGNPTFGLTTSFIIQNINGNAQITPPVDVIGNYGTQVALVPNPAYGAMSNGAFCAAGFFNSKSPLLSGLETDKSKSSISKNNSLWSVSSTKNAVSFLENLQREYPSLVREADMASFNNGEVIEVADMTALIPLLSKAIKEQSDIIEIQQEEINELKQIVQDLIKDKKD